MGCAISKTKLIEAMEKKSDSCVVNGIVVPNKTVNLFKESNATRFRGIDQFVFDVWQPDNFRSVFSSIKHCVHKIEIHASQRRLAGTIFTRVRFTFPQDFMNDLPDDFRSLVDAYSPCNLIVEELVDCQDVLEYATSVFPEFASIEKKIINVYQ